MKQGMSGEEALAAVTENSTKNADEENLSDENDDEDFTDDDDEDEDF